MGIGRRKFLRLASAALIGVSVNPLRAVVTNKDAYVNKKMGIIFQKPSDWGFLHVTDFGQIKDQQILGNGWNDSKEEIWEEIDEPICIVTKYHEGLSEHEKLFSPTITVNVSHKSEYEELELDSFEELMELSAEGTAELLTDFKILKRYAPQTISGCTFYEYDAEYLFEHVNLLTPLKVELKVLKAEHNDFYYDFNCHQSATANQIATKEFEHFKKSIKLI